MSRRRGCHIRMWGSPLGAAAAASPLGAAAWDAAGYLTTSARVRPLMRAPARAAAPPSSVQQLPVWLLQLHLLQVLLHGRGDARRLQDGRDRRVHSPRVMRLLCDGRRGMAPCRCSKPCRRPTSHPFHVMNNIVPPCLLLRSIDPLSYRLAPTFSPLPPLHAFPPACQRTASAPLFTCTGMQRTVALLHAATQPAACCRPLQCPLASAPMPHAASACAPGHMAVRSGGKPPARSRCHNARPEAM